MEHFIKTLMQRINIHQTKSCIKETLVNYSGFFLESNVKEYPSTLYLKCDVFSVKIFISLLSFLKHATRIQIKFNLQIKSNVSKMSNYCTTIWNNMQFYYTI